MRPAAVLDGSGTVHSLTPPRGPGVTRTLPPPRAADGGHGDGEGINSTKLAAGLRSVARNNKATRLLTRPG